MKRGFRILVAGMMGLMLTMGIKAQQTPVLTQYRNNEFLFNPAITGADGYTSVNLIAREQWLGIAESPKTHALSFQTRLMPNSFIFKGNSVKKHKSYASRDSRVGLGVFVYNDRTGLLDRTGAQISYAYHIPMQQAQFSFGLSANFYQFKVDHSPMILADNDVDQTIQGTYQNIYVPDVNFGMYLYSGRYYAGLSATDLTQSVLLLTKNSSSQYKSVRTFNLIAGYKYRVNYNLVLEPSTLVKVSEKGAVQADLGIKALFNEDYWAGLSYRTKNTMAVMGGIKVDRFYFGYAFEFSFSQLQQYTYGTHEITAAMRFGENARRYRWLNKF